MGDRAQLSNAESAERTNLDGEGTSEPREIKYGGFRDKSYPRSCSGGSEASEQRTQEPLLRARATGRR
jgi:hypothetical protein